MGHKEQDFIGKLPLNKQSLTTVARSQILENTKTATEVYYMGC